MMKKFISTAAAAAILALSTLTGAMPASAAPVYRSHLQQDRYIGNYCDQNPSAGQCNDWRVNHNRWNNNQYQGFYRYHQNDNGFGGNLAAGLFGFAVGAAVAGSLDGNGHVRACEVRYRSYDRRSDTFLGYDGARHYCRL